MGRKKRSWQAQRSRWNRSALALLCFWCGLPLVFVALAVSPTVPIGLTPKWQLYAETLAADEPGPVSREGTYVQARFSRHRICLGPLEVRYSYPE